MNGKRFGIISSVAVSTGISIITFLFKVNLIAINSLGKISIYYWMTLVLSFFLLTYFLRKIDRVIFNWTYLGIVIFSFIYLNSMFQWSVECCPNEYESMSDWNASKSLAWMIHLPFTFVVIVIQGLIFDFLRERDPN